MRCDFWLTSFCASPGWDAEIDHAIFARKAVDFVFEVANPVGELSARLRRHDAGGLVREVGADVAIDEDDLAFGERGFDFAFGFEAIAGVEQSGEMRIDGFERAEFAVEKLADHFAEPGVVLRESGGVDADAGIVERGRQQIELRALAAAVDAFDGDEPAQSCGGAGKQCGLDPIQRRRMHRGELRLHLV